MSQARPSSQSDSTSKTDTADGQQLCGTCNVDVGDSPIGCDDCETWVHSTEMCSGLPRNVLDAILEYDGQGIKFQCMNCRLGKQQGRQSVSSGADSEMKETLRQLFQQFRGMCAILTDLTSQVKALTQRASTPQSTALVQQPTPDSPAPDRKLIREELTEMRERDKRRQSIIIKGLVATGPADAAAKFNQLTETQFGARVDLAEVMPIPNHPSMFRAKIIPEEQRKLVLDNAKKLKGSAYSSVYISRDLTRAQRTELYEKRRARLNQNQNQSSSGANPASAAPSVTGTEGISQSVPPAPQKN